MTRTGTAPAAEECGGSTRMTRLVSRLVPFQFWSCHCSSLPACSCFTSGENTTEHNNHDEFLSLHLNIGAKLFYTARYYPFYHNLLKIQPSIIITMNSYLCI